MPIDGLAVTLALAASIMTYAGGRVALGLRNRKLIMTGFIAGFVPGIALLFLLPEALEAGLRSYSPRTILMLFALGATLYFAIDRLILASFVRGNAAQAHLGPASLTLHSLFDGLGIGLGFDLSVGFGLVLALAVLAHDFADGFNTVGLSLGGHRRDVAHRWLLADAAAPPIGALIGGVIHVDAAALPLAMALLAGGLFYIGASQVRPPGVATRREKAAELALIGGVIAAYALSRLTRI